VDRYTSQARQILEASDAGARQVQPLQNRVRREQLSVNVSDLWVVAKRERIESRESLAPYRLPVNLHYRRDVGTMVTSHATTGKILVGSYRAEAKQGDDILIVKLSACDRQRFQVV